MRTRTNTHRSCLMGTFGLWNNDARVGRTCHMSCRARFMRGFKETEKNNKFQFHCCCPCRAGRVGRKTHFVDFPWFIWIWLLCMKSSCSLWFTADLRVFVRFLCWSRSLILQTEHKYNLFHLRAFWLAFLLLSSDRPQPFLSTLSLSIPPVFACTSKHFGRNELSLHKC